MILRSQWIRLGTLGLMLVCPALAGSIQSSTDASTSTMDRLAVEAPVTMLRVYRRTQMYGFCREAAGGSSF